MMISPGLTGLDTQNTAGAAANNRLQLSRKSSACNVKIIFFISVFIIAPYRVIQQDDGLSAFALVATARQDGFLDYWNDGFEFKKLKEKEI
jgi:hypothetical protein